MKLNLSLMRLVIKLLILLILFVVLFLISLTLYSTRYWKDIYNYINANITIKRIPTLTELNYVVINVEPTEDYTTTDIYELSTIDFDDDELTLDKIDFEVRKRSVENDYAEVPTKTVIVDYFFDIGERGVKDLIDESEMTTRFDDVEVLAGGYRVNGRSMEAVNIDEELSKSVFPWIAAIFVKNGTSDQFNYYCDGALLTNTAVITAASCVRAKNTTTKAEDFLVFFGKTSLKAMGDSEKLAKVKGIKVHENFSAPNTGNDLAILFMEDPVAFTDNIRSAEVGPGKLHTDVVATTGWSISGELTSIPLKAQDRGACDSGAPEDTVCSSYGNEVTVCPSYGGLLVTKHDSWLLQGIRTGDPEDRGLCPNRHIAFTSLNWHREWIEDNVK